MGDTTDDMEQYSDLAADWDGDWETDKDDEDWQDEVNELDGPGQDGAM